MHTATRTALLAGASAAVLAVTACGGSSATTDEGGTETSGVLAQLASDATGSLQKTVETTTSANSAAVTMTGTSGGEPVDVSGVISFGDSPAAELTQVDPEDGEITVRVIGSAFYVSIPEAEQASMDGKKWFKMDFAALGATSEDLAQQLEGLDPVQNVRTLLEGAEVTVVGEETIDGVPTVHYTSVTPVDSYLEQFEAEIREGIEEQLATAEVTEVAVDVWVDEQYQPRRVKLVMGTMSDMTMNYTDYGKAVTIEAPPAAETADFAELMQDLQDLADELDG